MSYQSLVYGSLTSETHTSWNLNWSVAVTYIIKSRPISVKTKSSFPWLTYCYCFRTRAVALPGWWNRNSLVNKPPPPPPTHNAQPRHTWFSIAGHLISGLFKCDHLQDFKKESFSICVCNTFLELLQFHDGM